MTFNPEAIRKGRLTEGLALAKPGLEVSPLYRPTVLKSQHNVFYTDYTSADESRRKHASYAHDDIMDIDFIWTPGKRLIDCVPDGRRFDWAIASHVMEHVPDPIGWLLEIFEVLNPGAIISLALPHKDTCFDAFRPDTTTANLVDTWVRGQKIPSPHQLYDFLSRSVDGSVPMKGASNGGLAPFAEQKRVYSNDQALDFVLHSWVTGDYLDAHCSVFTPESFVGLVRELNEIGILNVDISEPHTEFGEFIVKLTKKGEPRRKHPGGAHAGALGASGMPGAYQRIEEAHAHAVRAFEEAVRVQELYKAELARVIRHSIRIPGWLASLLGR